MEHPGVGEAQPVEVLARVGGEASALTPDPGSGIFVPLVSGVRDGAQGSQDVVPASLILGRPAHRLCDERAALAPSYSAVQLRKELVFEVNVYTHAHNLAHSGIRVGACPPATRSPENGSREGDRWRDAVATAS